MKVIQREALLKVAKQNKHTLWERVNVANNKGRASILDHEYSIYPSCDPNGIQVSAFTPVEDVKFMPELIGLSPNDPDFGKRCRYYWESIYHKFSSHGLDLDISFIIDDDSKEKDFNRAPESEKHLYGRPVNLLHYMLYRYCLNWSRVANTYSIYKQHENAKNIKYYFYTEQEAKAEQTAKNTLIVNAMLAFQKALEDNKIAEGVLRYFERGRTSTDELENIGENFLFENLDDQDKQTMLLKIQQGVPERFIQLVEDPNTPARVFVYRALNAGILQQLPGTQIIQFGDTAIGNTFDQVLANLTSNIELRNEIKLRLADVTKTAQS